MSDKQQPIAAEVQIIGINTDKTRKANGSETRYQIYFLLSAVPSQAWRNLFEQEWKKLNPAEPQLWQEASIDRDSLVLYCSLAEIETFRLPVLKQAVLNTNKAYRQYLQDQTADEKRRQRVWTDERKAVEDMARSLHFDT